MKELKREILLLATISFSYMFRIRIEGDKIITIDLHGPDYYGYWFQYHSFRYLSSCGKHGDSIAEMLNGELAYI